MSNRRHAHNAAQARTATRSLNGYVGLALTASLLAAAAIAGATIGKADDAAMCIEPRSQHCTTAP
ncbi:MAG: hypothetical protein AAF739_03005 [Pseudomonadota bacterium]